jgi:multiple sugar transport system substrate-binding protein
LLPQAGPVDLRGIAWDHPRGIAPLRATAAAFSEMRRDVRITWEARSLQQFAYARMGELAANYDLLVIDHPHVGDTGMADVIVPLDDHLAEPYLAEQEHCSTGPSYASYRWAGHQWALAVDAAAQVAAYRRDLLDEAGASLPRTWDEVLELAATLGPASRIAIPLTEIDAACSLMSIGANLVGSSFWTIGSGYDPHALTEAVALLTRLATSIDPRSFATNPIQLLQIMGTEDSIAYAPLVFGYSNYAREGYVPHLVSFGNVPGFKSVPRGSVLGGAGLAVSQGSRSIALASEYTAFVASPTVQRSIYFTSGGQPGHRSAWVDPGVNAACNDFFTSTLGTLDESFLRPRIAEEPNIHQHQARVGRVLRHGLQSGHRVTQIATAVSDTAGILGR